MRVYNFAAGPATLPVSVLERAQKELLDYRGLGMSVMEITHRSKPFEEILFGAEENLRKLMGISDSYDILFLQGGASTQFAMVPLNLFTNAKKADFIHTGVWSKKAIAEARRYGLVNVVASSEDQAFNDIPSFDESKFDPKADYFHITTNNTIYGTRYRRLPNVGNVPLVADMSSNILSEKSEVMDVSRYGLIYAGAQKNIGPAGVTLVIIRKDLIGRTQNTVPTMLNYETHAKERSLFNTPPVYPIYIASLVFEWLMDKGGIEAIQKHNEEKAALLYDFLDDSALFSSTVQGECRSLMNVPFLLPTEELNASFIRQAAQNGLVNLKGHRSVGGMRASIYNAMSMEGVEALVAFMKEFELSNR
ncbi:MAG: 3-phosphoserine/phosphohydroxythreonine transaminase [Christensenellales bacterium]|jgi:phosphoserine aminotransferase